MAYTELPTINFDSNPGLDEWSYLHSVYSEEFKLRSSICETYGIVDRSMDPASAPFTTGRPLLVTVSPVNPVTIDIASGIAITPSNLLVYIDAAVPSVPLPDIATGKTYVVAVEYVLVPSTATRVDRYGVLTNVRYQRPSNTPVGGGASTLLSSITIADINDYNNSTIFTPERLENIVVIGIVSVLTDTTTGSLYLSIDLTNTTYAFNRPWYSTIDTTHRSLIGSGLVTTNNPHGLDLQDLSTAGLTLYQQLLTRGSVVAKDFSYYGYPGRICTEAVSLNRFVVDATGTTFPPLPNQPAMAGRWYFTLTKLPVRCGSLYLSGQPWKPIPYEWIQGTRNVLLGTLENPSTYVSDLVMEYFAVDALEVGPESPTQGISTLEVKQPVSQEEFIVSGGLALAELTQTSIALTSTLGPIKKHYEVLCDSTGALVLSPQPLVASINVADLTGTPQTVNQSPFGGEAVYMIVGLHGATKRTAIGSNSFDLNLKLTLTGLDNNGATLQESIVFKASQWEDQSDADVEQPMQYIRTFTKFSLITMIAVANTTTEPHYAGNDAVLTLWADIIPAKVNQDLCKSASFFWDGTKGIQVRDERIIGTTLQVKDQKQYRFPLEIPEGSLPAIPELFSTLLNPPLVSYPIFQLMTELDDDRIYGESWEEFSTSAASGSILYNVLGELTLESTIRISEGKYLKIVQSGANADLGEVNWADTTTSTTIFLNNLISTINNPTFESLWFATLGTSGSNPPISLSRQKAYPEGFILNKRKKIVLSAPWVNMGSFITITINGTSISQMSMGDSDDAIDDLIAGINAANLGVRAILPVTQSTTTPYFILNGLPDGETFDCWADWDVGFSPDVSVLVPTDYLTFTQPSGGILPTPHLPNRFPSEPWNYLTRPFLWSGVFLEAKISITDNDNVTNNDIIEIATGKPLTAKKAPNLANPSKGEFQVSTATLGGEIETLQNMASTVNDSVFASGVYGEAEENSPIFGESVGTGNGSALFFTKTLVQKPNENSIEILVDGVVIASDDGLGSISGVGVSGTINYLTRVLTLTFVSAPDHNAVLTVDYTSNVLKLKMAGTGNSTFRQISQAVSGTWVLQNYTPVGSRRAHAFMKTLYPLASAEWRYQTVEDVSSGWTKWEPLDFISPTAFKFQAPPMKSIYQFQLRLVGADKRPNGFSLYQIEPETSGADIGSLDVRLTAVEDEIETARGTTASLDDRISGTIMPDGSPIPNAEILASYDSVIMPSMSSLKKRLDTVDSLMLLSSGGFDNFDTPVSMQQVGANLIVSGPMDGLGNSNFIAAGTGGDQGKLLIGGGDGISTPSLVVWLDGFSYVFKRNWYLSFLGQASGTYFVYMERGTNAYGLEIMSSTGSATAGSSTFTSSAAISSDVTVGHLLVIPNGYGSGDPIVAEIVGKGTNTLTISGKFPVSIVSAAFTVNSLREGTFGFSVSSTPAAGRIYLGEVVWVGSPTNSFSSVMNYRYQDRYVGDIKPITLTTLIPNYEVSWNHQLGRFPAAWKILYYVTTDTTYSNPKILQIGDEAVVKMTRTTLTVRNRYASLVARSYDGTTQTTGNLQLIVG